MHMKHEEQNAVRMIKAHHHPSYFEQVLKIKLYNKTNIDEPSGK